MAISSACATRSVLYSARGYSVASFQIQDTAKVNTLHYEPAMHYVSSPMLPFVSNCDRFGNMVPLFMLLKECIKSGNLGRGGKGCNIPMLCMYEDFVNLPNDVSSRHWWEERPSTAPLFYITKRPMSKNQMEMNIIDVFDADKPGSIDIVRDLVPVTTKVIDRAGYIQGSRKFVPSNITLEISLEQERVVMQEMRWIIKSAQLTPGNFKRLDASLRFSAMSGGEKYKAMQEHLKYNLNVVFKRQTLEEQLSIYQAPTEYYAVQPVVISAVLLGALGLIVAILVYGIYGVSVEWTALRAQLGDDSTKFLELCVAPLVTFPYLLLSIAFLIFVFWAQLWLGKSPYLGPVLFDFLPVDPSIIDFGAKRVFVPSCTTLLNTGESGSKADEGILCLSDIAIESARKLRIGWSVMIFATLVLFSAAKMSSFDAKLFQFLKWKQANKDVIQKAESNEDENVANVIKAWVDGKEKAFMPDPDHRVNIARKADYILLCNIASAFAMLLYIALPQLLFEALAYDDDVHVVVRAFLVSCGIKAIKFLLEHAIQLMVGEVLVSTPFLVLLTVCEMVAGLSASFEQFVLMYIFGVGMEILSRIGGAVASVYRQRTIFLKEEAEAGGYREGGGGDGGSEDKGGSTGVGGAASGGMGAGGLGGGRMNNPDIIVDVNRMFVQIQASCLFPVLCAMLIIFSSSVESSFNVHGVQMLFSFIMAPAVTVAHCEYVALGCGCTWFAVLCVVGG